MPPTRRRQHGFTYLGLLILLAVISLVAASTLQVGAIAQRRAAEDELLAVGTELRQALESYAAATPEGQRTRPASLELLLHDARSPGVRRHLRRIHADPLSGSTEWGLVRTPDGAGIIGVFSLHTGRPIKTGNFDFPYQGFKGATAYSQWTFMASE